MFLSAGWPKTNLRRKAQEQSFVIQICITNTSPCMSGGQPGEIFENFQKTSKIGFVNAICPHHNFVAVRLVRIRLDLVKIF